LPAAVIRRCEAGEPGLTAAQLCILADTLDAPLTHFHRPAFAHPGLPAGMDASDLLALFDRLSLGARQEVVALAERLAARPN
jgi:hypothetical protein